MEESEPFFIGGIDRVFDVVEGDFEGFEPAPLELDPEFSVSDPGLGCMDV